MAVAIVIMTQFYKMPIAFKELWLPLLGAGFCLLN